MTMKFPSTEATISNDEGDLVGFIGNPKNYKDSFMFATSHEVSANENAPLIIEQIKSRPETEKTLDIKFEFQD